jgi:hypothetical protein
MAIAIEEFFKITGGAILAAGGIYVTIKKPRQ